MTTVERRRGSGSRMITVTDDPKALLASAQRGDPKAVDSLLALHQQPLYRFGLRMCGNEADARDVLQETLIAALRGLPQFRGDAELSTWLYQLARSFCLKARRRRAGEPSQFDALEGEEAPDRLVRGRAAPEQRAQARELSEAISSALLALPEKYREAVILKDVEGLSAEEAAKVVGVDLAAFKSRLHRGRGELREHLAVLLQPGRAPESPCPELAEELEAYVGAELDQAMCVQLEAHLEGCPRCAATCEGLKKSVSLCRRIPGDEVPRPVQQAVRAALLSATAPRSS